MLVGINYAWRNYGWDFGLPPHNLGGSIWGPRAQWRATIDEDLARFARLGLFAVRWFILGDGVVYGTGAQRPHEADGWRVDYVPALSPEFEEDFSFLLARIAAAGLRFVPSLIDFHFCFPGTDNPAAPDFVKGGRADIVNDPAKRGPFLDRVLGRLLQLSQPHREAIYAWEIINEPEWCTQDSLLDAIRSDRTVPLESMRAFIREAAGRISAAGFRATVGLASCDTISRWDTAGLGVTLHQFHYYAEPRELPEHTFDPRWPAFIGELATAPHRPWAVLPPDQDVFARLRLVESKGYPAAFLWAANVRSDEELPAATWAEATQAQVRSYTGAA